LQDAATGAAEILKSSCAPNDARTPPARLAAVGARLDSLLQAIGLVRPPLDIFYNSLTDEQRAAFDAIGPERNGFHAALATDPAEIRQRHYHHGHHYGYNIRGIFRMFGL
jgi:LTXXQ motif family protein